MQYDKESLSKRIGEALHKYRSEILKDSATKVAERCETSVSTISKLEAGKGTLNLEALCNIIKVGYLIDYPILFLHDHNPFFNLAKTSSTGKIVHIHKDSPSREIVPPASQTNIVYDDKLEGAKIKFRRLILQPGQDSKEFTSHGNEEFSYIEKGNNVKFIFTNYGVRALSKGDIIHFAPGLLHKAVNDDDKITAQILVVELNC